MNRVIGFGLLMLVLGLPAAASAQDRTDTAPVARQSLFSVEGSAGVLFGYGGNMQSLGIAFTPVRRLTLLVTAERDHVPARIQRYANGYSATRGGTEQFVSFEVRFAFFADRAVSPYVLGGSGRGVSRLNVNEFFPNKVQRNIQVVYYGAGARIPIKSRVDAFVDTRFILSGGDNDYTGVYLPVRAGIAWRF